MSDFRFGVVIFPGSNCEQDVVHAVRYLGFQADYIWHQETNLDAFDAVILPGGFSYGDYLRCGAIARFSPVMEAVSEYAQQGRPVLGICNGFQILTEAGLLPGVLLRNRGLKFICQPVSLRVETRECQWLELEPGSVVTLPINHNEGNYYCDDVTLARMRARGQVVVRYSLADGSIPAGGVAPNGALDDIAGVCNEAGNVFGLMPHPERVTDGLAGRDGGAFFSGIVRRMANGV